MGNDDETHRITVTPGELAPPPAWTLLVNSDGTISLQLHEAVEGKPWLTRLRVQIHADPTEAVDLLDLLVSNQQMLQQHADAFVARLEQEAMVEDSRQWMARQIQREVREAGAGYLPQEAHETYEPVIVDEQAAQQHARVKEAIEREYGRWIEEAQGRAQGDQSGE